jgi:hypothetical protein
MRNLPKHPIVDEKQDPGDLQDERTRRNPENETTAHQDWWFPLEKPAQVSQAGGKGTECSYQGENDPQ